MNNLFRRAVNIFKGTKAKEKTTEQSEVDYTKLKHMHMMYARYSLHRPITYGTVIDISRGGFPLEISKHKVARHFLQVYSEPLHEVYKQYLLPLGPEDWLEFVKREEIEPGRIRYGQKLIELDRRMKVLESEREVNKEIRFAQTRQMEYLEADVESLKEKEKGPSEQADKVKFTTAFQHLLENVGIMEEMRDDPIEFEQARASFLSQLRGLEVLKPTREPYFTDLLTIIDVGVAYADGTELTEESFNVLRDALRSMSREVTSATLKELRKRFRESGINILKPLDLRANVGELLKEIFK